MLCAALTFPAFLRGRLVHVFVDNQAAKAGLIKGTSSAPDSSRILLEYHVQVMRLQCLPWVSFVYSGDNLADPPSRGDFELMGRIGAVRRPMRFPRLQGYFGTPSVSGGL